MDISHYDSVSVPWLSVQIPGEYRLRVIGSLCDSIEYLTGCHSSYITVAGTIATNTIETNTEASTQWAHDVIKTSLLRRNDVATSFRRNNDVMITLFDRWDINQWEMNLASSRIKASWFVDI